MVPVVGYCFAFIDAGDVVTYHGGCLDVPFNFKESLLVYGCHPILPVARLLDVSHLVAHDVRMLLTSCFPSLFGLGAVATHELFRGLLARGFLALWVIDYALFPYLLVAPFRWLALPVGLCFEIPSFGRDVR